MIDPAQIHLFEDGIYKGRARASVLIPPPPSRFGFFLFHLKSVSLVTHSDVPYRRTPCSPSGHIS